MCTLKHAHVLSHTNTQTHTHTPFKLNNLPEAVSWVSSLCGWEWYLEGLQHVSSGEHNTVHGN